MTACQTTPSEGANNTFWLGDPETVAPLAPRLDAEWASPEEACQAMLAIVKRTFWLGIDA